MFSGYAQRVYPCEICGGGMAHNWVGSSRFTDVKLHDGPCWQVFQLAVKINTFASPLGEKTLGFIADQEP